MKEFFATIWDCLMLIPKDKDFASWSAFVMIWVVVLLINGLAIAGILSAFNTWFRPIENGYGVITSMWFEEAYYSSYMSGKVLVQQYHPNAWKLIISLGSVSDDFYCSKEDYVKQKVGKRIRIEYKTGRLWKSLTVKTATL